jgi:hypothetical protein
MTIFTDAARILASLGIAACLAVAFGCVVWTLRAGR